MAKMIPPSPDNTPSEFMHAVAAVGRSFVAATAQLQDIQLAKPSPTATQLLVKIRACSLNPVDGKLLAASISHAEPHKVLGFDAVADVVELGAEVTGFQLGDRVYYAGDVSQAGSFAEFQVVDHRLVALAPSSLSDAQAAALPLTSLTAWEGLFERLPFTAAANANQGKQLLIIGAAGGVGSIATQLAKWAGLTVTCTASQADSRLWCQQWGADQVVDHQDLLDQCQQLALHNFDAIACFSHTDQHFPAMIELVKAQGDLLLIVDNQAPLAIEKLKPKSVSLHWEFMFTRALHHTADMAEQGQILKRIAALVEQGQLRSTLQHSSTGITAHNITLALQQLQQGHSRGKWVFCAEANE